MEWKRKNESEDFDASECRALFTKTESIDKLKSGEKSQDRLLCFISQENMRVYRTFAFSVILEVTVLSSCRLEARRDFAGLPT